jgi:hypothetical protein
MANELLWTARPPERMVVDTVQGALRTTATAIGVITGAATILGWLLSTASPAAVAGRAVGYLGMGYCVVFAVLGFVSAVLPKRGLRALESEGLAKTTLRARALYLGSGCFFAAMLALIGTNPLDGTWITIGTISLLLAVYATLLIRRNAVTKRKAEFVDCPDCLESVRKDARVCRYCGYRFRPAESDEPAMPADGAIAAPARSG